MAWTVHGKEEFGVILDLVVECLGNLIGTLDGKTLSTNWQIHVF